MSDAAQSLGHRQTLMGYVEAITKHEVVGWARKEGADSPLTVEVRFEGKLLATATASEWREDLKNNGVGNGAHGFRVSMPTEFEGDLKGISVTGIAADGEAQVLEAHSLAGPDVAGLDELKRSVGLIVGSQRLLHRNLQAALLRSNGPANDLIQEIKARQADTLKSIESIEIVTARLEAKIALLVPGKAAASQSVAFYVAILVASIALAASIISLTRAI